MKRVLFCTALMALAGASVMHSQATANVASDVAPQNASMGVAPAAPTNLRFVSGAAASISVRAGSPQNGAVGAAFGLPLSAIVLDAKGIPVFGQMVTFTVTSANGASGTFASGSSATAVTDGSGVATAPTFTANGVLGDYTVSAVVAGASNTASFALTEHDGGRSGGQHELGQRHTRGDQISAPTVRPEASRAILPCRAFTPISAIRVPCTRR